MHTVHFDLSGEKFHQLKWKALIKTFSRLGEYWWLSLLLSNFPGFEIEILSEELTLALMTGDHWGLTLVTGGVQLKSIVRSHSHKPHWRVIRDLYIINSSQSVSQSVQPSGLFTFLPSSSLSSQFWSSNFSSYLRVAEAELSDFSGLISSG